MSAGGRGPPVVLLQTPLSAFRAVTAYSSRRAHTPICRMGAVFLRFLILYCMTPNKHYHSILQCGRHTTAGLVYTTRCSAYCHALHLRTEPNVFLYSLGRVGAYYLPMCLRSWRTLMAHTRTKNTVAKIIPVLHTLRSRLRFFHR